MPKDFIPARDTELLPWVLNLSEKLTATPTAFGATAAMATALEDLVDPYEAAQAVVMNPLTRTRATILIRDQARAPMKAMIREIARVVNAYPPITNDQRVSLGFTPRKSTATPIGPPQECPVLEIVQTMGRMVKIRLHGQDTNRRGKPDGVEGATVFSYVGNSAPADITLYKFEGSITRTSFNVEFPPTVPAGSQVWLCAFWFSPTSAPGPACQPVSAYLAGGVAGNQQAV